MKQGLTEIICVIDKSGSMANLATDAIGGFNTFLQQQKFLPGDAIFTLTLFDTDYKIIHNGISIKTVPELTPQTYSPGGMTALFDAVGRTIDTVGQRLNKTPESERPEKIIVAILTDGQENSSKEYTRELLFDKIKLQHEIYKWEFVFLAANQNAMQAASSIGINPNNAVNFAATANGVAVAYRSVSDSVTNYRVNP